MQLLAFLVVQGVLYLENTSCNCPPPTVRGVIGQPTVYYVNSLLSVWPGLLKARPQPTAGLPRRQMWGVNTSPLRSLVPGSANNTTIGALCTVVM